MGSSTYSDDDLKARFTTRSARGVADMTHDADVKAGRAATTLHPSLDIRSRIRESRDSEAHPRSKAIAVVFDHTGSMGDVPRILQKKLASLMALLLRKGYCVDPQLCFACVGDYHTDHPDHGTLQVGQFESGAEIDDAFTAMAILSRGGGSYEESYELAAWYFANCVEMDCLQKRGEKGLLFLIGDEKPYCVAARSQIKDVCGVNVQGDQPVAEVFRDLQRKFEVFFVIPGGTSHYGDPVLKKCWADLVGPQRVIEVEDPAAVCEVIAATIGQLEGAVDTADVAGHLLDVGVDARTAAIAARSTAHVAPGAIARVGGDLPARRAAAGRL